MSTWSLTVVAAAAALSLTPVPRFEPRVPPAPARATIAHYNGSGVNVPLWDLANGDVPAAVVSATCPTPTPFGPSTGNTDNAKAVGGQQWGPILNLGVCVTGPGNAIIRLRPSCANGATLTLPGGCHAQILQSGTLVGTITAPHNGLVCNVPNQSVPLSAVGFGWSTQAVIHEFGTTRLELSSVIYGTVDVNF